MTDFPHFDPQTVASQGNAILGIRDSGKSYTAIKMAEMLFDAGIPFVAFDPIGRWRFLRVPGLGDGYPVVVAGGMAADLPLSPESAVRIVRAAMEAGVSLIDPELLAVIMRRPEIQVTVQRHTIQTSEEKTDGMLAILISEGFFDNGATGYSAFEELKRHGLVHALAHIAAGDTASFKTLGEIAAHAAYLEAQLTEIQSR